MFNIALASQVAAQSIRGETVDKTASRQGAKGVYHEDMVRPLLMLAVLLASCCDESNGLWC